MLKKLKSIGPGAMVAAAFIGPGTVTTATIAGASYGYTLLWAVLFSVFATIVLQEMSARLGVIGKLGLGEAIQHKIKHPVTKLVASFLVIGAILVGNAAYEAGNITGAVLGFQNSANWSIGGVNPLILTIGIIAFVLLFSAKYKLIERVLVLLVTVMGIVFLCSAILLKPDLILILKGLFNPSIPDGAGLMIIGLIGTTVVPYNLFLHASSVQENKLISNDLSAARWDTILSVMLGGLITASIIITSAIALNGSGLEVKNAADLSAQLEPLLGDWASTFLAFGFLAAGLSSSITAPLAAAFATAGIMGWKRDLKERKFRIIWMFVLAIGIVFSSLGFKPLFIIFFAQITNGLLLPIIALFLLWIMNDKEIMGKQVNSLLTNFLGISVVGITLMLGLKSILKVLGYF